MGTTGSGKTYKMHELLQAESSCFLFNLMDDEKFETWGVSCDTAEDAFHLAWKCRTEGKPFRIKLQSDDVEMFDYFCKLLIKQPYGHGAFTDTAIAVDELALFCSPSWMPDGLRHLVRLGRHTNARLYATTQRPPDINPFIRSQAKEIYLFQMHEPADLDVFRKRIESPERLITLQQGEYILWYPNQMKKSLPTE